MERSVQFLVTLSDDLLHHLQRTARETHVPLCWLVAGLVCDTLETRSADQQPAKLVGSENC